MPSANSWSAMTYGNGYFVAVNQSQTTAGAYSTNGTTWTASTMSSATPAYQGVTYGNGKFIAVCGTGTNNIGSYSTNGTSWTSMTMPSASYWYGVAYGLIGATGYYMAVSYTSGNIGATQPTEPPGQPSTVSAARSQ